MRTQKVKLNTRPVLRPLYTAWTHDGKMLEGGEEITCFRGEKWVFDSCAHPRKIYARKAGPGEEWGQEFYPSVFELIIK